MDLNNLLQDLKDRPVLKTYLKRIWSYLCIENLVELNVNLAGFLRLEIAGQNPQFIETPELDFDYWFNLCSVLANGNGFEFDPESQPRVSVQLPGGHRFEGMVGDNVKNQLSISIRIKRAIQIELQDFGLKGNLKERIVSLVQTGANIIISGGTNSGKTTFLNRLLKYIPENTRILTVEDTYEVDVWQQDTVNYRVSRNEANPTIGYPQMIDHLVRSRPDMIIAGEVSVANAFPIIRMLNSGHSGFISTVHANSPELALSTAIPQNIVMAGISVPNIKEILYELTDLVIQLHKVGFGKRVTEILFPKTKELIIVNE